MIQVTGSKLDILICCIGSRQTDMCFLVQHMVGVATASVFLLHRSVGAISTGTKHGIALALQAKGWGLGNQFTRSDTALLHRKSQISGNNGLESHQAE